MSDIKLFRTTETGVAELSGGAIALEKSLQTLIERNIKAFLGVRFLASVYATTNGGRMSSKKKFSSSSAKCNRPWGAGQSHMEKNGLTGWN
jgi:hypothetical protein